MYISVDDWYYYHKDGVEEIVIDNLDYCAEPHQLELQDIIDNTNFDAIVDAIEINYDVEIVDCEREEMFEIIESIIADLFETDKEMFYI